MVAGVLDTQPSPQRDAYKPKAPTIILLAGFAGVEKTTLAKRLSHWLHWEILNEDELKLQHLAKGEKEEQAGWNAFEELMQLIEEKVIKLRKSVIIDTSNEKPFMYESVQQVIEQLQSMQVNTQLHIVLCKANREIRTKRLKKRGSVFAPYI